MSRLRTLVPLVVCLAAGIIRCGSAQNDDEVVPDISPQPFVFEADRLPSNLRYMPSVSNGHLASNVYSDTICMNGLYTGRLGWSYRARIQALHSSNLSVTNASSDTRRYSMDIEHAVYEERISTSRANVTYRMYAHHYYNRLLVTEVKVVRLNGVADDIVVTKSSLAGNSSADLILGAAEPYSSQNCTGNGCMKRNGTIAEPETDTSGLTPVYLYWREMDEEWTLPAAQQELTWTYLLAVDIDDTVARNNFDEGMRLGSDQLLQSHTDGWMQVWNQGNIEVDGDLALVKVIQGSLFYLYANLPSHNTFSANNQFYGLSPGGLANGRNGSDYYGHVFWDMETWMYPPILMFRPDLAKDMLSYRINGIDPAKERAASGGYLGTRYPWESGYTGAEVTPDICVPCRELQQHITGDIAFAARQYISATRDIDWLTSIQGDKYTGIDFVHNMALFWFTRPSWNMTKQKYEINGGVEYNLGFGHMTGVMPPDEHQQMIDNSIYTNTMASLGIHMARYAACLAGQDPEASVPDRWINVAQNVYFPYHRDRRYHEEYEGFEEDVRTNRTHSEWVKQADVVLLGFPIMWTMPDDVRKNDMLEYEPITTPGGPAMTWGMFAVGWLDTDEVDTAAVMFNKSYQPYTKQPYKIWTEAQQGLGAVNFITGMGGFLQTLMFGYGGMRLHVEELHFKLPRLPPDVTRLKFNNLNYMGMQFDYGLNATWFSLYIVDVNATLPMVLTTETDPTEINLIKGSLHEFLLSPFKIFTTRSSNCTLPTDDINVDYTTMMSPTTTTTQAPTTTTTLAATTTTLAATTTTLAATTTIDTVVGGRAVTAWDKLHSARISLGLLAITVALY